MTERILDLELRLGKCNFDVIAPGDAITVEVVVDGPLLVRAGCMLRNSVNVGSALIDDPDKANNLAEVKTHVSRRRR